MALWLSPPLSAQEIEIRRWNPLPIDGNFVTANFGRTDGDIAVDPVLLLQDVSVELDTWCSAISELSSCLTERHASRSAKLGRKGNGIVDEKHLLRPFCLELDCLGQRTPSVKASDSHSRHCGNRPASPIPQHIEASAYDGVSLLIREIT
jgi:hypothetical protein